MKILINVVIFPAELFPLETFICTRENAENLRDRISSGRKNFTVVVSYITLKIFYVEKAPTNFVVLIRYNYR